MFEYDGRKYTMQDLQAEADRRGLDINDYISQMKSVGMTEIASSSMDSGSDDGSSELPEDKGFIEDMVQVFRQSKATAGTIDDAFDIYKLGKDISDEQIQSVLDAKAEMDKYGPTNEQASFAKDQKANGGGIVGTLLALKDNPGFIPQFLVGSAVTMAGSLQAGEVRGATALSAGVGAAGGAAAGSTGFTLGPLGVATTTAGAVTGTFSGAIGGLVGSMETGLTLMDLIQEEVGEGVKLTKENIKAVIEDTETFEKIKQRAAARGRNIGAVEAMTLGISRGVGSQLVRAGKFRRAGVATTAIETTGGFTGEIAGQIGAEQDIDLGEATLEAIGEVTGAGQVINVAEIVKGTLRKSEYNINGEKRSKQEILDLIESDKLTNEEKTKIKFNVKNDEKFAQFISGKLNDISLETQIDAKVEDPADRTKLVDLEKQRTKAEADTKKSGIFKVINAESKLESIDMQINEIVGKYTAIDGRTSDVRARKKAAEQVRENIADKNFETNLEFAKKHSKLYGLEVEDNLTQEQIKEKYGDELANSLGGIVDNKLVINKKLAKTKVYGDNVANHELLHGIIKASGQNIKQSTIKSFLDLIGEKNASVVQKRIDDNYDAKYMSDNLDEYFTIFSDAIANNEIQFNDNIFTKIKDVIRRTFADLGYAKVDFESAQGAYNFLKDYNKSIHKGALASGTVKATKGEGKVQTPKLSKTITDAVDKLGKVDKDGNNLTEKGTGNFYYQAEADDVVKQIKEKGYLDNLIAARYKADKVPKNFVSDVITALTPDIKSFKPEENNSLFGYLQGRITFRAGDVYNKIYKQKEENKGSRQAGETTKEGEVKIQVAAETTNEMKELEEKDMSIQAQAKEKADKKQPKSKKSKESEFRNRVNFKTGSQIYNEIMTAAVKSLIRAYGKTLNIKDVAARERAVVKEIQKEHNSLTSPLFKQIKNWLSYGLPQEVIPRGTKDIYFQNLREFREDITKLVSTADLVQVEKMINEVDRIFTIYKGTLTKKGDVEKAVDNLELPPDAIRKYDKDKKVSVYDKTIPSETQVVAFANQPAKIPARDKSGNVMRNPDTGDIMMIRSGLKGTRKDGITKNIVNGLVLDAVMEARQSQEVKNKLKELGVDATSVQELSVATGRPADVKFSKSIVINGKKTFSEENLNNMFNTKIKHTSLMGDNQKQKSIKFIDSTIRNLDPVVYSTVVYQLEVLKEQISKDLTIKEIINSTISETKHLYSDVADYQMQLALHNGVLNKQHLTNYLVKAKRITDVQFSGIAFNSLVENLEQQTTATKINNFLKIHGKQAKTVKVMYDGKRITNNILLLEKVIKPIAEKNNIKGYDFVYINKEKTKTRITYKGEEQTGFQNSTEIKQAFKNEDQKAISEIIKKYLEESDLAIKSVFEVINSKNSKELMKSIIKFMAADTDAVLRKIAKPGKMAFGVGKTVLDHRVPINKVIEEIYKTIDNPTSANKQSLKEFLENTYVNNIPKNVDTKLNASVKKGGLGFKTYGDINVYDNPEIVELMKGVEVKDYSNIKESRSTKSEVFDKALQFSRSTSNPTKGITVLDFDDTLATTKSLVKFTRPDGTTGTLNAEQYASTYENLLDQGYTFDFSEFNKVVKGKLAPLFQKALKLQSKFGPKNMFVLTARPPAAQKAIFDFLKANGLNIPIDNITGLGNSTAEAKALWIADKVGEGFNDFYFADDALQNVQAVKNMLDQFDVKSKVQQARVKFSKSMDDKFNNILEDVTGIETQKRFSAIKGRKRGDDKGKFRFFIPPSHEDFVGLLYNFMGEGRKGDAHRDFLEQALVRPLNRAYRELDTAKQAIANDYKKLNEQFPDVNDKLIKSTPDGDFTFQDAIRVYLWNKHGHKIPGLTETDQAKLTKLIESDPQLQAYAETLNVISKQEDYVAPGQAWETANIRIDLVDATGRVGRAQYLSEFIENADVLFSEENLNKIEAGYGKDFREALEDMLHRIKTGVNRPKGQSGKPNKFLNWLNASVAGVMFFNTRSALLQQLSNVNYLNFADNNILAAGKAFANQKQYWKDFAFILNSDMLKQRRGGIGTDVNGAELVEAIKKARPDSLFDQVAIITGKLLRLGFLPTQMGDSIAIATGGAAFYRNRINTYLKKGLSQKEAEAKAFTDFQDITQSTQQSARPDMTSQQQASWIGKLVLNFLNTPSQYNRIIKKAGSDLKNRRITKPNTTQTQSDMSNLSRILYYGAAQNLIFYGLQTALFAVMFGGDDDESEAFLKKKERVINGSIDTILRGSGIYGVALSTIKNMMIKFAEQREKGYNKDESAVIMEALNFSPVLGIRARKIVNAEKTLNYNTKVIDEMATFDIDNPQWSAVTNYVEGTTTLPVNRLYQKTINVRNALDNQYTAFQRAMFFSGYTTWSLDLGDTEKMKKIKDKVKSSKNKKKKKIRRGLPTR